MSNHVTRRQFLSESGKLTAASAAYAALESPASAARANDRIRLGIIGSIEQVCLSGVVFDREILPDDITENLCEFIFKGIERAKIEPVTR